jgi:hypothetical protein
VVAVTVDAMELETADAAEQRSLPTTPSPAVAHEALELPSVAADLPGEEAPAAEQAELDREEEEEEEDPQEDSKAPPLEWIVDASQFIVDDNVEIPVHRLSFDLLAKYGQPRSLTDAGVKQRLASLRTNPPSQAERALLWEPQPAPDKYIVLGGQHTAKALQLLNAEAAALGTPVPHHLTVVLAKVLRDTTPLDIRQKLAGAHQAAQGDVIAVPMSRTCHFVWEHLKNHPSDLTGALVNGVMKTGRPERLRTSAALHKALSNVAYLVEALGDQSEMAVANLERSVGTVTQSMLRRIRPLLTPVARREACVSLLEPEINLQKFDSAITRAIHHQWVEFHWSPANPKIHESRSMFFFIRMCA